ncbi:MAG: sulfotransferase [Acidobacteriota bacterium]
MKAYGRHPRRGHPVRRPAGGSTEAEVDQPWLDADGRVSPQIDFLVPGFSKCGSTTLCALLSEHPDIFMPARKDFRLFDLPHYRERWAAFRNRFSGCEEEGVVGEGSIWYLDTEFGRTACERILSLYPVIKILAIARDPIDRIESSFRELHHSQAKFKVRCPTDLGEALEAFPALIEDSLFHRRLSPYREAMDADRIRIVFLEELVRDRGRVLAACFRFLGLDPDLCPDPGLRRLNSGKEKLYDSDRWRSLQDDPEIRRAAEQIPFATRDELLTQLGLRIPFSGEPLRWSESAGRRVLARVVPDARAFLEEHGRDLSLWPRLERAIEAGRVS